MNAFPDKSKIKHSGLELWSADACVSAEHFCSPVIKNEMQCSVELHVFRHILVMTKVWLVFYLTCRRLQADRNSYVEYVRANVPNDRLAVFVLISLFFLLVGILWLVNSQEESQTNYLSCFHFQKKKPQQGCRNAELKSVSVSRHNFSWRIQIRLR